jgi:hypothetical protein
MRAAVSVPLVTLALSALGCGGGHVSTSAEHAPLEAGSEGNQQLPSWYILLVMAGRLRWGESRTELLAGRGAGRTLRLSRLGSLGRRSSFLRSCFTSTWRCRRSDAATCSTPKAR